MACRRARRRRAVDRVSLALLDQPELAYYRERALALNVLRRLPVGGSNGGSSRIADVLVDGRGRIRALVVENGHGERAVALSHVRMKGGVVLVEDDELAAENV